MATLRFNLQHTVSLPFAQMYLFSDFSGMQPPKCGIRQHTSAYTDVCRCPSSAKRERKISLFAPVWR